jgi:hypothetical protein
VSENRPSIETIVLGWKEEYGVKRSGDRGSEYYVIANSDKVEAFRALAKTFFDYGYSFEEINEGSVSVKISRLCWRDDKIKKMSDSEVKKAQLAFAKDWNEVLHRREFTGITISKCEPDNKPVEVVKKEEFKKEKVLEIDPSDRIKMDTSDIADSPLDPDFLRELGLDESFMGGKKDE